MKPAVYDIDITWGDTVPVRFQLQTKAGDGTLSPLDLTGSDVLLLVQTSSPLRKRHSDGGLTGDLAQGQIIWTPTSEESSRMSKDGTRYFIQRQVDGGEWRTYLTGVIKGSEGPSSG